MCCVFAIKHLLAILVFQMKVGVSLLTRGLSRLCWTVFELLFDFEISPDKAKVWILPDMFKKIESYQGHALLNPSCQYVGLFTACF